MGVSDLDGLDFKSCFFEDEDVEVEFETRQHESGKKYSLFENNSHRKVAVILINCLIYHLMSAQLI